MRLDKWIKSLIDDTSKSLKERVFIVLTMAATAVCGIAFIGDVVYSDSIVEIIMLIGTLIIVPIVTMLGVKTNRVDLATRVICLGMILLIMPVVFFFGGGVEGAVIPWLIFAYLYIGLVLSGTWRVVTLVVHTVIVAAMFALAYYYPDIGGNLPRRVRLIDSALAVIEVGYICFIMTWFQNLLYMNENAATKEETKKVERLSRVQSRFFSNMSHEIRTPINSILGLNEVILRNTDATDEIKKDSENIRGAGRMLLALINDILDFSKIESGKMDIVPVNYSIASLVSEVVSIIWHPAEEKGLALNVEIDPSIPSELYGDEIRIKQILINLLNNAVKYTKEGSVTLYVEKEAFDEDQVVLMFSVSDTGMGIKQEVIPYLFNAFKRLDEGKNAGIEGTGLGLSIVKQLVDMMGGRITVDSIYTQGSTFTVTLRQKVTRADAIGNVEIAGYNKEAAKEAYKASFTAPEARILIVDDSSMNLLVETKLLEGTQITVDTASGGEEALSMTLMERYDIILMDHLMPEMDGIECMQHIRKQTGGLNNRVPIIVLTANAQGENRELYARSGFEDYLLKPVTGRQLEEMLLAYLPATKVRHTEGPVTNMLRMNATRDYSRKLPVLVTCAGTCDLPARVIKEYQLDTIPYTVISEGRMFYDGVETATDELVRYMKDGRVFGCASPSVEDYRNFFGSRLKWAHNLIYISAAAGISGEYAMASEAAKSYENVAVIDSECCSSAVGFLVLIAQRMSSRGETFEKVCEEIERAKKRIRCAFVLDSILFLRNSLTINEGVASFVRSLGAHAFVRYKKGGFAADRHYIGDFDRYHRAFIDHMMPAFSNPDKDLIVVVYVDMSDDHKDKIESYIRNKYGFINIYFQRASAVVPIYMGVDAFGLVFFADGEYSYDLGNVFVSDDSDDTDVIDTKDDEPENNEPEVYVPVGRDKPVEHKEDRKVASTGKWYEGIPGMDPEMAIRNSGGSEETFRAVCEAFYESIDTDLGELGRLFTEKDWKNYTVKVHSLKSSSLLIGAKELADEALALEMAGKSGDYDFIEKNHDRAMTHLKEYKAPLGRVFGEAQDDEGFDSFLLESIYEALRDGASDHDDSMIRDTFEEADEYTFPEADAAKLSKLRELFADKDYDGMISLI